MDDWTPVVILLLEELMKGEYGTISIPREYLETVDTVDVRVEWTDDHLNLSLRAKEPV